MTTETARPIDSVLLSLLLLSLAGNVYLGVKVFRPSPSVASSAQLNVLPLGANAPPFDAFDLDGKARRIDFRGIGGNTVLYVFSQQCSWCDKNLENIQAISRQAAGKYRLIGISLTGKIADYIKETGIDFPVLERPAHATAVAYGLGPTPTTIVISPDGVVLKVWQGAYGGALEQQVASFFSVSLPGLVERTRQRRER
jgi:peroxiredoxin